MKSVIDKYDVIACEGSGGSFRWYEWIAFGLMTLPMLFLISGEEI